MCLCHVISYFGRGHLIVYCCGFWLTIVKFFDAAMNSTHLPRYSASVSGGFLSSSTFSHYAQKALPRQCDSDVTSDTKRLEPHCARSGRLHFIRSLSEGPDELYLCRAFVVLLQSGSTNPFSVPQHGTTLRMDNPESA